ncbi:hypothetical protein B0H14DRAFT_1409696 [Mycena olivaceomarginata]|nr:hypothetical protein B0H14DRAFT_1409696 [Mycena olivaceomarginata]
MCVPSLSKFTSYSYADDDADATLNVTSFSNDGFSDFKLDLSCLSSPPSPPPSAPLPSDYPFSASSPPSSSRRSVSLSTAPSSSLGRARSEWGENGAGGEDVTKDGVLSSTVHSTSIDSIPQTSRRSISPLTEWNYISPPPVVYKPYSERRRSTVSLEPLPESVKIHLYGVDPNSSAEWASTQKILASRVSAASTSTSTPELSSETHFESAMQSAEELRTTGDADTEQDHRADAEMNLGLGLESLYAAVDQGLGLIPGGMTWFRKLTSASYQLISWSGPDSKRGPERPGARALRNFEISTF